MNQKVPQTKVKNVVEELSIRIDNLCTFLPQEKVGKFTEMDAQKLLLHTEQALAGSGMDFHKHHMDLIEMQT